jgi:hypothetical protein
MALRLKNRRKGIPNGFMYEQRHTGWRSWLVNPSTKDDFNLLCRELQNHRRANARFNLPTDLPTIEAEVDYVNALRVATIPGASAEYLIDDSAVPPPPKAPALPLPERLAGAVAGLRKVNAGRVMLTDWEAAGYPQVAQELAEQRATICVSCPKNGKGDLSRWFTVPASERIIKQIERLQEIKLGTTKDESLGVCEVCLCPLRLKMHAPIEFVGKYLSAELKAELMEVQTGLGTPCWVISELK